MTAAEWADVLAQYALVADDATEEAEYRELAAVLRRAERVEAAARAALDGIHRVMPAGPELKQVAVALREALEEKR